MRLRLNRQSSVSLLKNYWWTVLIGALTVVMVSFLLTYKLGTLTAGFSAQELSQRNESAHIEAKRPLFIMQNGPQYELQHLKHFGPAALRLPGAIIAAFVALCFYSVVSGWYTKRVALLGMLAFTTSSWFLHISRLATHDVTFLLPFALFAAALWLQRHPHSTAAVISCFIAAALLLYIPGMLWCIVPIVIWQRRRIRNIVATFALWQIITLCFITVVVLIPLILAGRQTHSFIAAWLGFPATWPTAKQFIKNFIHIPLRFFWREPNTASMWLGNLPLLDWFQMVMFLIGIYAYRFMLRLDRTLFIAYVFVIGAVLVALQGPVSLTVLLPFIYLIIVSGIALMLQQWFTVFPRNPFARGFGITVLTVALLISCTYQLDHYFVAWPRTPETKMTFRYQP